MALTFMFLINLVAASMSGYNFLDQFTVRNDGLISKNITISANCLNFISNLGIGSQVFPNINLKAQACNKACAVELSQSGAANCEELQRISPEAGFGAIQKENGGVLGSLSDIFASVITFIGTLLSGILTFFLVAMQILIAPKNLGSFNIVIDMINAVCVVVVIAWVWKAILPTASD
jgi:hypothetical protein